VSGKTIDGLTDLAFSQSQRIAALESRIFALREALEVYQDQNNWLCEDCESFTEATLTTHEHLFNIWGMIPGHGYKIARKSLEADDKVTG
jgi:hypothetical protein